MDRLIILFIVLVTMLFVGMGIMISPVKIAETISRQYTSAPVGAFMTFASILFITGLVGIAVVGFLISKEQSTSKVNA